MNRQGGDGGKVGDDPASNRSIDDEGVVVEDSEREELSDSGTESDWDNGESLTPGERAALMKLSTYERRREMNIRARKRMEAAILDDYRNKFGDIDFNPAGKPKVAREPRKRPVPSTEPPRRSNRKGKNKYVLLLFMNI
jgi:hypothetical protein